MSWQLIPQVFYDFLARLVPGAGALVLTAAVVVGPGPFLTSLVSCRQDVFLLGPVAMFLLGSYLTGFIVGEVWEISLARVARPIEERIERQAKVARLSEHQRLQKTIGVPPLPLTAEDLPAVFVMHDHVRGIGAPDAVRLLKLQAERRLCHVLVLGCGVLVAINGVLLAVRQGGERAIVELILIVVMCVSWTRSLRLAKHFANGTVIAWLVAASAGRLPLRPNSEV